MIINDMLKNESEYISYTDDIQKRAEHHENYGIMALDAIHLACAESANADYFLTCDDKLIRKARKAEGLNIKITTLSEFYKQGDLPCLK